MVRFTEQEVEAVKRLLPYAERKRFVADFLLNSYDSERPVSVNKVMRYACGEIWDSTYRNDVFVVLDLMERGVEVHELIGYKEIKRLIALWTEA